MVPKIKIKKTDNLAIVAATNRYLWNTREQYNTPPPNNPDVIAEVRKLLPTWLKMADRVVMPPMPNKDDIKMTYVGPSPTGPFRNARR